MAAIVHPSGLVPASRSVAQLRAAPHGLNHHGLGHLTRHADSHRRFNQRIAQHSKHGGRRACDGRGRLHQRRRHPARLAHAGKDALCEGNVLLC
ncbi:hypothetical protein NHJ13734_000133 [Beauveria thailandica]